MLPDIIEILEEFAVNDLSFEIQTNGVRPTMLEKAVSNEKYKKIDRSRHDFN